MKKCSVIFLATVRPVTRDSRLHSSQLQTPHWVGALFFMFTKAQASRHLVSLSCRYLARLRPTPVSSLHYRLQWSETHKTLVNIFFSNISAVQFVWSQYFCHKTFMWVKISSSRRRCGRERRFSADKKGTTHKFFHSLCAGTSSFFSLYFSLAAYWGVLNGI